MKKTISVYPHGDHIILESNPEKLMEFQRDIMNHCKDEEAKKAASRIERGVDKGASKIAIPREAIIEIKRCLEGENHSEWLDKIEKQLDNKQE